MVCLLPFTPTRAIQRSPHVARSFASHSTWPGLSFLGLSMSWRRLAVTSHPWPSGRSIRTPIPHKVPIIPDYPRGCEQRGSRAAATLPSGGSQSQRCRLHRSAGDGSHALDRPGATGEAKRSSAGLRSSPQGRSDPGVAGSEPLTATCSRTCGHPARLT